MVVETVEERLEKLERTTSRYRLALAGMGVVVLACTIIWVVAGATGCAHAAKVIRANMFVLEDENGKVRAMLCMDSLNPSLALFDENGLFRVLLYVDKAGPGLSLWDEKGRDRVGLFVNKDGPGLRLSDEDNKPRAGLLLNKDGPGLGLWDEKGKVIWNAP